MMPFLGRELVTTLRRPARFGLMAILVGLAWLVTVVLWGLINWQQNAIIKENLSRAIFYTVSYLQLVVGSAVGIWAAGCIAGERERETWDLLVTIPTRTVRMVFEKISGHIVAIVLLMSGFMPFVGLCFLLGGVGPDEIVSVYAVIGSFILVSTCMGVACSAWSQEETVALRWFAIGLFLYLVVVPFLVSAILIRKKFIDYPLSVVLSPVSTIISLHSGETFFVGRNWMKIAWVDYLLASPWIMYLLISVGFSFLLLRVTHYSLQKQTRHERNYQKKQNASFVSWAHRASPFHERYNLIVQRELLIARRSRWGRSWAQELWIVGFCILFAICMHDLFGDHAREGWGTLFFIIFIMGVLIASTVSSVNIAGERRHGTWDILCTTLLEPRMILAGKYKVALYRLMKTMVLFSVSIIGLGFVIARQKATIFSVPQEFLYLWPHRPWLIPIAYVCIGSWVMYVTIRMYFSVSAGSPVAAQIKSFIVIIIHVTAPILILMFVAITNNVVQSLFSNETNLKLLNIILCFSPLTLIVHPGYNFGPWTEAGAIAMLIHGSVVFTLSMFLFRRASKKLQWEPETIIRYRDNQLREPTGGTAP